MCISNKQNIFFEAPNFGFGPISTTLSIVNEFIGLAELTIVSSGEALQLAKKSVPHLSFIEIDTFNESSWHQLINLLPKDAILICNTNPQLAAYAIENHVQVIVVDTLFWMWHDLPGILNNAKAYIAQWYFYEHQFDNKKNQSLFDESNFPIIWTRPCSIPVAQPSIVDSSLNLVVISFGGMSMPINKKLPVEYSKWVLEHIIPFFLYNDSIDEIYIVGGSHLLHEVIPTQYQLSTKLKVLGMIDKVDYIKLLQKSKMQLLTPGLSTIYEANFLNLNPMFLPGFNMSMVLQSHDYATLLNEYPHNISQWTWSAEVVSMIRDLPEKEGVDILSSYIKKSISKNSSNREVLNLLESLKQYMKSIEMCVKNVYPHKLFPPDDLPSSSEALKYLLNMG